MHSSYNARPRLLVVVAFLVAMTAIPFMALAGPKPIPVINPISLGSFGDSATFNPIPQAIGKDLWVTKVVVTERCDAEFYLGGNGVNGYGPIVYDPKTKGENDLPSTVYVAAADVHNLYLDCGTAQLWGSYHAPGTPHILKTHY